jgi:uncharacterized protein
VRRVLVDSGPLVALFDADDRWHARSTEFLRGFRGELVCSAANVTEAVWVASNAAHAVAANLIAWLARGAVTIANVEARDLGRIGELLAKYRDERPDFADLALLALAERQRIYEVLTVDQRDFARYRLARNRRLANLLAASR